MRDCPAGSSSEASRLAIIALPRSRSRQRVGERQLGAVGRLDRERGPGRAGKRGAQRAVQVLVLGTSHGRVSRASRPEALTTSAQRLISLVTNLPNASPVQRSAASEPMPVQVSLQSRRYSNAFVISAIMLSTMSFGVPLGAHSRTRSRPGRSARRASAAVGMFGKAGRALVAGDRQRLDAAGLDVRGRRPEAVEHHVDLAGDQVLQRRPGAAVRDVGDEGLGLQLEQLARQMVRGAVAGRPVVQLAGVLAHVVEKACQVVRPARAAG